MVSQNTGSGKTSDLIELENRRQQLEQNLTKSKTKEDRKVLGQFATPFSLAKEMAQYGLSLLATEKISFLEPSFGSGAIYSALQSSLLPEQHLERTQGFEIDPDYCSLGNRLWSRENFSLKQEDFLTAKAEEKVDLLLANPPYTRHHDIGKVRKDLYRGLVEEETNLELSGLAGLYCYFILESHKWLKDGAVCGWLIPCEFLDVNYGMALKEYLSSQVTLLHIHLFDAEDVQFQEAQITSCLLWYKNEKPLDSSSVSFSAGPSFSNPALIREIDLSRLKKERKWSQFVKKESQAASFQFKLGDFFSIKRGLVTGDNSFFILSEEEIAKNNLEMTHFRPILPSPRYLKEDVIESDNQGIPKIAHPRFLLDCRLSEEEIQTEYPALWTYLQRGLEKTSQKYLCRKRKHWYWQEKREATCFVCSYMGRSKDGASPLRFIYNTSQAIAANSYLMLYPRENLQQVLLDKPEKSLVIWKALKEITKSDIEAQGRVYGGGLYKIEPKELERVPCPDLIEVCT